MKISLLIVLMLMVFGIGRGGAESIYLSPHANEAVLEAVERLRTAIHEEEGRWIPLKHSHWVLPGGAMGASEDDICVGYTWEPSVRPEEARVWLVGVNASELIGQIHQYMTWRTGLDQIFPHEDWGWGKIDVLKGSDQDSPFTSRQFSGINFKEGREWLKRQGIITWASHTHIHYRDIRPEHFETHPEWFAKDEDLKPMRPPYPNVNGFNDHPDLSRDDVVEVLTEGAKDRLKGVLDRRPSFISPDLLRPVGVTISTNDSFEFGHFPADYPYAPKGYFRRWADWSNHVFHFSNRVAERMIPEAEKGSWDQPILGAYAYLSFENVPDFEVHPNILPMTTYDRGQYYDLDYRRSDEELMPKWKQKGTLALGTFDYLCGHGYIFPRSLIRYAEESVKFLDKVGLNVYFNMASPIWAYDGHMNWLIAKLLQNPDRDGALLMDAYFKAFYGLAEEPMRAFFDKAEYHWMNQPGHAHWLRFYLDPWQAVLFSLEDVAEMEDLLEQACQFDGPQQLTKDAFELTAHFLRMQHLQFQIADNPPKDLDQLAGLIHEIKQHKERLLVLSRTLPEKTPLHQNLRRDSWFYDIDLIPGSLANLRLHESDLKRQKVLDGLLLQSLDLSADQSFNFEAKKNVFPDPDFSEFGSSRQWKSFPLDSENGVIEVDEKGLKVASMMREQHYRVTRGKPNHLYIAEVDVEGKWGPSAEIWIRIDFYDRNGKLLKQSTRSRLTPPVEFVQKYIADGRENRDPYPSYPERKETLSVADYAPEETAFVRFYFRTIHQEPNGVYWMNNANLWEIESSKNSEHE